MKSKMTAMASSAAVVAMHVMEGATSEVSALHLLPHLLHFVPLSPPQAGCNGHVKNLSHDS